MTHVTADRRDLACDIVIVGGGLSGLKLAHLLEKQGRDYQLIEARDRWGGRIYSPKSPNSEQRYDMGPAWFWTGQMRVAALIKELALNQFDQTAYGNLVFQEQSGNIRRDIDMATMEGAYRVEGGLISVIDGLVDALPNERLHLNIAARQIAKHADHIWVSTADDQPNIKAQHVILCLPPRLAEHAIEFTPHLPKAIRQEMKSCATWMAAHAKFIAVYDRPFWNENGLSGDAISHIGPMMEMHDASPAPSINSKEGAIFGFLGVPADARKGQEDAVIAACRQQLVALFGDQANAPLKIFYEDWAEQAFTATPLDANGPQSHPQYHSIEIDEGEWHNHLYLSSTETAPQFGGFIEGALEAAEATFKRLQK
jgi:monoamine oxidase